MKPLAAGVICLCLACTRPVAPAAATGLFVRSTKGADTLWVHPAGVWVRHARLDQRGLLADSGRWTQDTIDGHPSFAFERFNFHRVLPPEVPGRSDSPGFWLVTPERTLTGKVHLAVDRDVGDAFELVHE